MAERGGQRKAVSSEGAFPHRQNRPWPQRDPAGVALILVLDDAVATGLRYQILKPVQRATAQNFIFLFFINSIKERRHKDLHKLPRTPESSKQIGLRFWTSMLLRFYFAAMLF